MAWITLTAALLQRRMPADWPALKRAAKGNHVEFDSVVEDVIRTVTGEVRGYVSAWRPNAMGSESTVPSELEGVLAKLARLELISMIPGGVVLDDKTRERLSTEATRVLRDVAAGRFAISPPADSATSAPDPADGKYGGDTVIEWPDTTFTGDDS